MKDFKYKVMDPIGIHARPAGLLAKEAAKYASKMTGCEDVCEFSLNSFIIVAMLRELYPENMDSE